LSIARGPDAPLSELCTFRFPLTICKITKELGLFDEVLFASIQPLQLCEAKPYLEYSIFVKLNDAVKEVAAEVFKGHAPADSNRPLQTKWNAKSAALPQAGSQNVDLKTVHNVCSLQGRNLEDAPNVLGRKPFLINNFPIEHIRTLTKRGHLILPTPITIQKPGSRSYPLLWYAQNTVNGFRWPIY